MCSARVLTRHEPHVEQVEWQKRGLPHAHILLILDEPIHPDRFDEYVQAELPDHTTHPTLRDLVETHMLHGPCGPSVARNPPCWRDGKCDKRFPRPWCSKTHTPKDGGYVEYRRRQDGRWYQQRSKSRETPTDSNTYTHPDSVSGPDGGPCSDPPFDNRHVVPYNALLLLKYQCHVNVEICSSIKSVKYVYKYVYKGQTGMTLSYYLEVDGKRVTPSMTGPSTGPAPPGSVAVFDEIEDFVSGRSVCAHEAAWRLLGFNLQEQLPNTYPLCLHLPGEQTVHLPAEDQQHIMEEIVAGGCGTPLTAFFRLNADFNRYAEGWGVDAAICHFGVDVSTLLYHSVPKYFTIRMDTSTRNCKWDRRKHGCTRVQGRLNAQHHNQRTRRIARTKPVCARYRSGVVQTQWVASVRRIQDRPKNSVYDCCWSPCLDPHRLSTSGRTMVSSMHPSAKPPSSVGCAMVTENTWSVWKRRSSTIPRVNSEHCL